MTIKLEPNAPLTLLWPVVVLACRMPQSMLEQRRRTDIQSSHEAGHASPADWTILNDRLAASIIWNLAAIV